LHSDFYASKLLYWACKFDNVRATTVKRILQETNSHPEAMMPTALRHNQTAFHAAAMHKPVQNEDEPDPSIEASEKLMMLFNKEPKNEK
jgi:hypothetical protein